MTAASLELCRQLYELSGWRQTDWAWWSDDRTDPQAAWKLERIVHVPDQQYFADWKVPAYDLGYLLRKQADEQDGFNLYRYYDGIGRSWGWEAIWESTPNGSTFERADTPEDAAAKLAVELFKRGILKPRKDGDAVSINI